MGIKRLWKVNLGDPDAPEYIDLDPAEFDNLLADKGYLVTWEKSALCPNRRGLGPSDHKITCTLCEGTGFIFFDPQATEMLITGVKLHESYYAWGRFDGGSVMVTSKSDDQIGYWDRLTLRNSSARFTQLVYRQPGAAKDRLKYTPLAMVYVIWVTSSGALQVATLGTHYSVSGDEVTWLTSTKPPAGHLYTAVYTYRQRYIITDLIHQHRESSVKGVRTAFPLQATAKLDFLIRDEGQDASTSQDQDPLRDR
jgi:hypothetical protein